MLKTAPKKSLPLRRHIGQSYIRLALISLLVGLALITAYLLTNSLVHDENIKALHEITRKELLQLTQQESIRIEKELFSVEQLTDLYRHQTEKAYRTPFTPSKKETDRYRFSPKGAWYTTTDIDAAAAYYSSITNIGENEKKWPGSFPSLIR